MRTAEVCPTCPTYENAKCVIYEGTFLPVTNISPGDSLEVVLAKLEIAIIAITPTTSSTSTSSTTSSSSTTTTSTTILY